MPYIDRTAAVLRTCRLQMEVMMLSGGFNPVDVDYCCSQIGRELVSLPAKAPTDLWTVHLLSLACCMLKRGRQRYFPSEHSFTANAVPHQMENPGHKRRSNGDDGPPGKKFKTTTDIPGSYSDAVRKKLQTASRTGQACDRCKVCNLH